MAKDPAFLFYHHDFLVGTDFMTAEEVGCYIRILCHMADKGRLSKERMINVCRGYVITTSLEEKFKIDENGLYYNERLENEVNKRKNFCESRRLSRMSERTSNHTSERMVNRNRDRNVIKDKTTKVVFNFEEIWNLYPRKDGKKEAERHFKTSVLTDKDFEDIKIAVNKYIEHTKGTEAKYIKNGSTWFNNWKDWINYYIPKTEADMEKLKKEKYKL